ncbi:hypothetical protein [Lacimicrobium sp. SS2-24]|uniref:hypothetical protein n=1 Tax=Lacimicrobium sp. SS2-24 TaxID=2005569 RepID=UPI000B4B884B|nr:hypothetical protein [Lacimicrobium sp. SS2-24]
MHYISLLLAVLLLTGCNDSNGPSQSQLRLTKVHQQAQAYLDQAKITLSPQVMQNPAGHVQTIFTAHHLVIEARQVYRKAEVFGLELPAISEFENKLASLNPALAEQVLTLMSELMQRTLVLREKVQKIRNAESGVGKVSGAESIKRLSRLYNEEVQQCCLKETYSIIEILHEQQPETYKGIVRLGMGATDDMVKILQDKDHATVFAQKISRLRSA